MIYVTDNVSNNKAAFQGRGRGWQSCFCHNLNLVMGQVISETPSTTELVDNAKKLVRYAKKKRQQHPKGSRPKRPWTETIGANPLEL